MTDLYDSLLAEERDLVVEDFTLEDAWQLGSQMRAAAVAAALPIAIGITFGQQRVFHTALPGSSADNDDWLARKTMVALRYARASLTVGESFRVNGQDFDVDGRLDTARYAAHGGVVPLRLHGGIVIGTVGVSGLPELDDHAFVVAQLRAFLARR